MAMTGATEDQVVGAVERRYIETSASSEMLPWYRLNPDIKRAMASIFIRDAASWIVPPDHRIVSVADLSDLVGWVELYARPEPRSYATDVVSRIRALIGEQP